jgi:hypothetical protein
MAFGKTESPGLEDVPARQVSAGHYPEHHFQLRAPAMALSPDEKAVAVKIAGMLHSEKAAEAAAYLSELAKVEVTKEDAKNPDKYNTTLLFYVHNLLETGGMTEAAQILWSPTQFNPEPRSSKDVWNLFDTSDTGLIMGAAKMSKSFSMGVRLFLEWVRDPEYTTIRVVGPSENHLEENLFSHLVSLHQHATLPMPGEVGDLFIGLNRRDQMSSIRGVIIPKGNVRKAGRLQGGHRRPRIKPHPVFGPLSRMFIFLDEVENIPMGIWQDIDNVLSEIEKGGQGFKVFGAYNPSNMSDEVAKRAEPEFGWGDFDPETHFRWRSIRGWQVLRLDGERCENVLQGKVIYPGLQTQDGLERIASNAGGRNASGYMTMGRGCYPTQGIEAAIIPPGLLMKMRGEYIWYEEPGPISSTDLALEGGDNAIHTVGSLGLASGIQYPPSLEFPKGRKVMFKDPRGNISPRWGLQANLQFPFPKGDTVAMEGHVLSANRKSGTRPELYACDRTGTGAGVADLIKNDWSTSIHDVNYSEGASDTKIMMEDTKTCKEEYERVYTELWFALRIWGEFGYFLIHPSVDMGKLTQQLTQRRFKSRSGKKCAESKKDFKSRGFSSPDEADSLTLLVHAARRGKGIIPSMKGAAPDQPGESDDDWTSSQYPGGVRIDPSNRSDYLSTGDLPIL